jgi:hypothetical protein
MSRIAMVSEALFGSGKGAAFLRFDNFKAVLGCCPFRAGRNFGGKTQGGTYFAGLPWAVGCSPVGAYVPFGSILAL